MIVMGQVCNLPKRSGAAVGARSPVSRLGHGLPTVPLGLTEGLPLTQEETCGRYRGMVRRPCPNGGWETVPQRSLPHLIPSCGELLPFCAQNSQTNSANATSVMGRNHRNLVS